jgi:phenylpyruvate tautomerase PptA (4-oxalocrotonate tautomerase family)
MPMLEVIYTRGEPPSREQKRAFCEEAVIIFAEVLGTPPGRLRLVMQQLQPSDSIEVLEDSQDE